MVNPGTTMGAARPPLVTLPGTPPLNEKHDAVYDRIGLPPSLPGAAKLTVIWPLAGAAVGAAGASGTSAKAGAAAIPTAKRDPSDAANARRSKRPRLPF